MTLAEQLAGRTTPKTKVCVMCGAAPTMQVHLQLRSRGARPKVLATFGRLHCDNCVRKAWLAVTGEKL